MKSKMLLASLLVLSGALFAQTAMEIQPIMPSTPKTDLVKGKHVSIVQTMGERFIARATDVKGNTTLVLLDKNLEAEVLPLAAEYNKATSDYLCKIGDQNLVYVINKGAAELRLLDNNGQFSKQMALGTSVIKIYPFYTKTDNPVLLVQYKKNYELVKLNRALEILARSIAPKDFAYNGMHKQWVSGDVLCTSYSNAQNYIYYCAVNLSNLEMACNKSISKNGVQNRVYSYGTNMATIDVYPNADDQSFAVVERYVKNFPAVCVRIYDNLANVLQEKEVFQERGEKIAKGVTRDYLVYEDVQVLPDNRIVISATNRPVTTTMSGLSGSREFGQTSLTFYVVSKNAVETVSMGEIGYYDYYPFFLLSYDDKQAKLLAFEESGYNLLTCDLAAKKVNIQSTATKGDPVARQKMGNEYFPTINTIYNKYEMPWGYIINLMACRGLTMFRNDQSADMQNVMIVVSKDLQHVQYYTSFLPGMLSCDFDQLMTDKSNNDYAIFHRNFYAADKWCNQFVALDNKGEISFKNINRGIPFRVSDKEFYLLNDLSGFANPKTEFSLDKLTVK